MTNKIMADNQPNAWIVLSRDKGRKKIYRGKETGHRKVYLQDGDKFAIELYNPTPTAVLAKISLDAKEISNSGIIVKPGQRIYLERYLDEDRSFKFETYDVEDTSEVREAISNNGRVDVKFYNEVQRFNQNLSTITTYWGGNGWRVNPNYVYTTYTGGFVASSGSVGIGLSSPTAEFNVSGSSPKKSMETGQVAKGESTGQNFRQVDMDFATYPTNQVTFWLMPESRQPLTKKQVMKSYAKEQFMKDKSDNDFFSESEKINSLFKALNQLKELKDNKLITKKEFDEKRELLMNQ